MPELKTSSELALELGYPDRHMRRILRRTSAKSIREGRRILYSYAQIDDTYSECEDLSAGAFVERDFEDQICAILDSDEIIYERQKRVENGIIDLLIYGQPPKIIEVKRFNAAPHLMQAIVQLRFYGACFRKSKLYIAVPDGVPERFHPLLKSFNIGEMRVVSPSGGEKARLLEFSSEVTDGSAIPLR
jgi:hypothetical protein